MRWKMRATTNGSQWQRPARRRAIIFSARRSGSGSRQSAIRSAWRLSSSLPRPMGRSHNWESPDRRARMKYDFVAIGGGNAGLGATSRIAAAGHRVALIDRDNILALREVPKHLVIIGAGVVAFEFGQVFARLGSRVTFLVRDQRALGGNEQELVEAVVEFTRTLGAEFIFQASVQSVKRAASGLMVAISAAGQTRELPADFVLNAAGRVPSIARRDLAKADDKLDCRGIDVYDPLCHPVRPG